MTSTDLTSGLTAWSAPEALGGCAGGSVSPKSFEATGRQGRVPRRILDIAVAEVRLEGPGIDAIAGQLVAAGMPQHVRMHFDAKIGRNADHAREAGSRQGRAALRHKHQRVTECSRAGAGAVPAARDLSTDALPGYRS